MDSHSVQLSLTVGIRHLQAFLPGRATDSGVIPPPNTVMYPPGRDQCSGLGVIETFNMVLLEAGLDLLGRGSTAGYDET